MCCLVMVAQFVIMLSLVLITVPSRRLGLASRVAPWYDRDMAAAPGIGKLDDSNLGLMFTYREAAMVLWRAPKTIKNLVCKHRIPTTVMVIQRTRGRHKTYRTVINRDGLRTLRELIHGIQEGPPSRRTVAV